jgi:hypothetical protein
MSTLKDYKKEIKKLFFMSVRKDIKMWIGGISKNDDFRSPLYKKDEKVCYFLISRRNRSKTNNLSFYGGSMREEICKTNFFHFNFKIWWYARKLKLHFIKENKDKKDSNLIEYFKSGVEIVESNFIKEIRKEKLEKIKK